MFRFLIQLNVSSLSGQNLCLSASDDASIALAIEAKDAFVARLEAIRDQAQGQIEQNL
jgi:hypothetical protein